MDFNIDVQSLLNKDTAVKRVKGFVLSRYQKPVKKNKNICLKAGDSVTFVVRKDGLEFINLDENNLLVQDLPEPIVPHLCSHTPHEYCNKCIKNQLKSKL